MSGLAGEAGRTRSRSRVISLRLSMKAALDRRIDEMIAERPIHIGSKDAGMFSARRPEGQYGRGIVPCMELARTKGGASDGGRETVSAPRGGPPAPRNSGENSGGFGAKTHFHASVAANRPWGLHRKCSSCQGRTRTIFIPLWRGRHMVC